MPPFGPMLWVPSGRTSGPWSKVVSLPAPCVKVMWTSSGMWASSETEKLPSAPTITVAFAPVVTLTAVTTTPGSGLRSGDVGDAVGGEGQRNQSGFGSLGRRDVFAREVGHEKTTGLGAQQSVSKGVR